MSSPKRERKLNNISMYLCTPLSFVSLNPVVQKTVFYCSPFSFKFLRFSSGIKLRSTSVYGNGREKANVTLNSLSFPACLNVISTVTNFFGHVLASIVKMKSPENLRGSLLSLKSYVSQLGWVVALSGFLSSHVHSYLVISHVCFAGKMSFSCFPPPPQ